MRQLFKDESIKIEKNKQTRISYYYSSDFHWQSRQSSQKRSRFLAAVCLVVGLPSVWRRDSRWRWRRSRVAPACFPAGSSESSYSRYESCPRCKQNQKRDLLLIHGRRCWFRATALPPNGQTYARQDARNWPELLFAAHELDESVLVGLAPLQLQHGAVDHVRLQKQTSGFLVQPVLWRGVFLHDGDTHRRGKDSEPDRGLLGASRRSGNLRTLRSMLSRISSMEPCCLMRSMARLGPIPLMVPQ